MDDSENLIFDHFTVNKNEDGKWDVLGRGGMGITYRAYDTKLRRTVALKVINPSLLDEEDAYKMFLREARAAANLNHRNVAQIYQVGTDEEKVYYAMEFIEGETIDALVKRRKAAGHPGLELKEALLICQQTVQALLAAETRKLVHRDIKPSNIMVTAEDDGAMLVKLIDFGLAKSLHNIGDQSVFISRPGFMGTPTYASPEQITDQPLDIRADFYSLGATLWYMLEGIPPFRSDNHFELYNMHLSAPIPSERLAAQAIPPCVIELLENMLGKDPTDRPQDARTLLEQFRACINALGYSGPQDAMPTVGPGGTAPGNPSTMATAFAPGLHDDRTQVAPSSTGAFGSPATRKSKAPLLAVLGLLLVAGAGGAWWWINNQQGKDPGFNQPGPYDLGNNPPTTDITDEELPPTPKVDPALAAAAKDMEKANQLRDQQRPSAAFAAYQAIQQNFPNAPEAPIAKSQSEALLKTALTDPSRATLATWQPQRATIKALADQGSTAAAYLGGLLYKTDDPAQAKSLLSQARAGYTTLEDRQSRFAIEVQLAELAREPAEKTQALQTINATIAGLVDHPTFDPKDARWEATLTRAADLGSQPAFDLLATTWAATDSTRAISLYRENALRFEAAGRWHEAVALYQKMRAQLGEKSMYPEQQLRRLFNQWSSANDTTIGATNFAPLQPLLEQAANDGFPQAMLVLAKHSAPADAKKWQRLAIDHYLAQQDWPRSLDALAAIAQAEPESSPYVNAKVEQLIAAFGTDGSKLDAASFQAIRPQLEILARQPKSALALMLAKRLEGVENAESLRWYRTVANQEGASPTVLHKLGTLYDQGTGTAKDPNEAIEWYRKAVDGYMASTQPADALPSLAALRRLVRSGELAFEAQKHINFIMRRFEDGASGYTLDVFQRAEPAITVLAELGNTEAMSLLGYRLQNTNPQKAAMWLKRAAKANVDEQFWPEAIETYLLLIRNFPAEQAQAEQDLSSLLSEIQDKVSPSATTLAEMAPLLEKAAKIPVVPAMRLLSMHYKNSNPSLSAEWLTKAAENNDTQAMLQLGLQYSNGHGVAEDENAAFKWLSRAHELGDPDAKVPLADCYLHGKGTAVAPDKAIALLEESSNEGNPRAMNMLGAYYSDKRSGDAVDYDKAIALFRRAADLNHGNAYGNLGVMYGAGHGTLDPDPAKAASLWKKGIALEDINSMYFYGSVVYSGEYEGVEKDEVNGLKYIRQAAAAGHPGAKAWLKSRGLSE